jgi:hypothetical protein
MGMLWDKDTACCHFGQEYLCEQDWGPFENLRILKILVIISALINQDVFAITLDTRA